MLISSSYFLGVNFKTVMWLIPGHEKFNRRFWGKINSILKKEPQRKTSLLCWMWTKHLFSDCYLSGYLHLWLLLLPHWRGQPREGKGYGKNLSSCSHHWLVDCGPLDPTLPGILDTWDNELFQVFKPFSWLFCYLQQKSSCMIQWGLW